MKFQRKKLKGSVLGFSLMMLSLILFSGLTVISVAIVEKKSSFATQKSVIAFQAADSAAERILKRIYIDNSPLLSSVPLDGEMPNDRDLNSLANNLTDVVDASTACSDAIQKILGANSPVSSPNYTFEVTFYDEAGNSISCTDLEWRDKVILIRSEGFYRGASRVIEIGIRPRV